MVSQQDWIAWENEARTRPCPLCQAAVRQNCTKPGGDRLGTSHAVRGQHHKGRRVFSR